MKNKKGSMSSTIKSIRPMTKKEMNAESWRTGTTVIEMDDGTLIYASRDEEGNDSGCLFGVAPDGEHFRLT